MSWEMKSLDELGFVSRGRSRHRPRDAAHLYGGPYPFIQTGDVKHSNLYITSYNQTYSEAGLAQSKLWEPGTLCITIAANIADTSILKISACFPDSIIGFVPDEDKADARFVKYLFDAMLQKRFKTFTQGAAQDNLSQGKLLSLKFPVPKIAVQRDIADTLSSYDDLIENNRRRIQLLEESARLLYKEWFVRLRFPGHEHVKVVDGVPEGWEKKALSFFCHDARSSINPADVPSETPYIGLEHIPRRSITLGEWGYASDVDSQKFKFSEGNILFGKIRPYFHKVGIVFVDGITSSDAIVIQPVSDELRMYVLMLLSSDSFVNLASQTVKEGSKMPRADWKYLLKCEFLNPPQSILSAFNSFVEPIIDQLKILSTYNRNLAQARDLLLPRFMNGEVAV